MARFLSFSFALAAATLILFGRGATPASAQAAQTNKYPEAQEAFQLLFGPKHDMAGAIKKLEDANRKYPELPSPHVLMYQIFASQQVNQPAAALAQLEEAVKTTPSDPEPYVILGSIALQQRRIAEATMDFDKARQLLTTYTNEQRKGAMQQQMLSGIAQVAEAREDWTKAESLLREFLKSAPEDLLGHQRLARALFWQTKVEDAYKVLRQGKEIDRENAKKNKAPERFLTPEAIMAKYYDQFEGKSSKSGNPEKWYKYALKMAPDDLPTRREVAVWALDNGKLDFAKEQAEAALRIEAANQSVYGGSNVGRMLRGFVALWEKDWPTAENYFEKVIYESPNDFGAKNDLALALVEQDDQHKKDRALQYAEGNYSANKDNADALSTLGWVYFRRDQFDQARLVFDQAIKASGGNFNADTATYIAHVFYHLDQKWQAREILDNVLKTGRPFYMKPEALKLFDKVKDARRPAEATPAVSPTTPTPKAP